MTPLTFTPEEFKQTLLRAQEAYASFGKTRCPYFHDVVHFNNQGLEHLRRKSWNRGREQRDQFMRLKFLTQAPEILRQSQTVQGIHETKEWERRHRHGRWEQHLVAVTYYQFIAVLSGRRFKVIVKQLPGGERIFWSLIPFWRQDHLGKRVLHDGNLAEE
jgi:hypothetical protein